MAGPKEQPLPPDVMGRDDAADDGHSETGAAGSTRPRCISPEEALEHPRCLVGLHPRSVVADSDDRAVALGANVDRRRRAGRCVGTHVGEQVVEDLAQLAGVSVHHHHCRDLERDRPVRSDSACCGDRLHDDLTQVDRHPFERSTLVKPCQQQQLLDELVHPCGLEIDAAHGTLEIRWMISGTSLEQLAVGTDGRERRS